MANISDAIKIVGKLPENPEKGIIYFLRNSNTAENLYSEYIYINNKWERLGGDYNQALNALKSSIDSTISNIETKLNNTVTPEELQRAISQLTPTSETDSKIKAALDNSNFVRIKVLYTSVLPAQGQPNIIYLKPKSNEDKNNYYEYIWLENRKQWEMIGSRSIDKDVYITRKEAKEHHDDLDNKISALDNKLSKEISDEAIARENADSELENKLKQEIEDRTAADEILTDNLAAEIEKREESESAINEAIRKEESERKAADETLESTKVDTITSDEQSIITINNSHSSENNTSVKIGIIQASTIEGSVKVTDAGYVSGTQLNAVYEDIKSSKLSYKIPDDNKLPSIDKSLCETERKNPNIYLIKQQSEELPGSDNNKLTEQILIIKEDEDGNLPGYSYFEKLGEIGFDAKNYYSKKEIGRYIEKDTSESKEFTEDNTVVNYIDSAKSDAITDANKHTDDLLGTGFAAETGKTVTEQLAAVKTTADNALQDLDLTASTNTNFISVSKQAATETDGPKGVIELKQATLSANNKFENDNKTGLTSGENVQSAIEEAKLDVIDANNKTANNKPITYFNLNEISFEGDYVALVPDGTGRVKLYIRENKDYPLFDKDKYTTDNTLDSKILYPADGIIDTYNLFDASGNYNYCKANDISYILSYKDNLKDNCFKINDSKCNIRVIVSFENADSKILEYNYPDNPTKDPDNIVIINENQQGITLTGKIHKVTDIEAPGGFTPNTLQVSELKIEIGEAIGGNENDISYKVFLYINDELVSDENPNAIVEYIKDTITDEKHGTKFDSSSTHEHSFTFSGDKNTCVKWISGIPYICAGNTKLTTRKLLNSTYAGATNTSKIEVAPNTEWYNGSAITYKIGDANLSQSSSPINSQTIFYVNNATYALKKVTGTAAYTPSTTLTLNYNYIDKDGNTSSTAVSPDAISVKDVLKSFAITLPDELADESKFYTRQSQKNTLYEDFVDEDATTSFKDIYRLNENLEKYSSNTPLSATTNNSLKVYNNILSNSLNSDGATYIRKFYSTDSNTKDNKFNKFTIMCKSLTELNSKNFAIFVWPVNGNESEHAMRVDKLVNGQISGIGKDNGIAQSAPSGGKINCVFFDNTKDLATQGEGIYLKVVMYNNTKTISPITISNLN